MRYGLAILCLAGCSFKAAGAPGSGSETGPSDARGTGSDGALADSAVDGPPDACVDVDQDGICDDVDTWLCGDAPTPPGQTITHIRAGMGGAMTITFTTIDISNQGQLINAHPGDSLDAKFHWALTETRCKCIDQIEVGFDMTGGRMGCVFNGTLGEGQSGDADYPFTAPADKGVYDFATDVSQAGECDQTSAWWPDGTAPAASWVIAKVCVH